MKTITATSKDGQILPDAVGDWPEGCRLRVEPLGPQAVFGICEEDWSNSLEAIADWLRWYDSLEPLEFTSEEEADVSAWWQSALRTRKSLLQQMNKEEAEIADWRQRVKEYTIAKTNKTEENLLKSLFFNSIFTS